MMWNLQMTHDVLGNTCSLTTTAEHHLNMLVSHSAVAPSCSNNSNNKEDNQSVSSNCFKVVPAWSQSGLRTKWRARTVVTDSDQSCCFLLRCCCFVAPLRHCAALKRCHRISMTIEQHIIVTLRARLNQLLNSLTTVAHTHGRGRAVWCIRCKCFHFPLFNIIA